MLFNDVLVNVIGDVKRTLLSIGVFKFNVDKGDVVYSVERR